MSLTLVIENVERLDNDGPTQLRLDRHGAVIGRSPHADWSLPDPKNYISSTHCEIDYRDGTYLLIDKSTNGTLMNEGPQRIDGPQALKDGDLVVIGHYRIRVRTKEGAAAAAAAPPPQQSGWGAWDAFSGSSPAPAAPAASRWDAPPASAPISAPVAPPPPPSSSGWDAAPAVPPNPAWGTEPAPSPSGWTAEPASAPPSAWAADPAPTAGSGWDAAPADADWDSPAPPSPSKPLSDWASPAAPPKADAWGAAAAVEPPKSGWDSLSTSAPEQAPNSWDAGPAAAISGRGPMAQNWSAPSTEPSWNASPAQEPAQEAEDVWARFAASNSVDWTRGGFGEATSAQPVAAAAKPTPAPTPAPQSDAVWAAFVAASGLPVSQFKAAPADVATAAGKLLKRMVSGLVVMLEARARAKAQLGAQSTTLELGGNNPLKFARGPDQALAQLLNPPERGFMEAERAVDDSFQDLQAHQMATLAAMQGALRSTVDRFSPEAIRTRAETRGLLARILPSARNAALWEAYQREFEGVARGSDEAFLDVFAKAFKAAYEQAAADMKRGGR